MKIKMNINQQNYIKTLKLIRLVSYATTKVTNMHKLMKVARSRTQFGDTQL